MYIPFFGHTGKERSGFMQINRYINGEKTKGFLPIVVENKDIQDVIAAVQRRIRAAEEKA